MATIRQHKYCQDFDFDFDQDDEEYLTLLITLNLYDLVVVNFLTIQFANRYFVSCTANLSTKDNSDFDQVTKNIWSS